VKGQELYKKAKKLIPGGVQLFSKRSELHLPELWPAYYSKSKGVEVTDLDGNTYIDMYQMAVGACVLGYADPDVDSAVKNAMDSGSASILNCPEEVELAELLCELHPWADMVRYARCGGEAMAIAVRIARAKTGREKVAFCGYHGWSDWYLAANLSDKGVFDNFVMPGLDAAGVPKSLAGTAFAFHYNKIDELEAIAREHKNELAAIVMEPMRGVKPDPGFLERVREISTKTGAVMIFDEVTSGFRMAIGGQHLVLNVEPDIAVFAKSISNGYPMAAIIGREEIMQAAQITFISSTSWAERTGPTAALATIRKYQRCDVAKHLIRIGEMVIAGWKESAKHSGLKITVEAEMPPIAHFAFDYKNAPAICTLFTQMMLERGFLAGSQFKASFAHRDSHVEQYTAAVNEVFAALSEAIATDEVEKRLKGPIIQQGFYRLT